MRKTAVLQAGSAGEKKINCRGGCCYAAATVYRRFTPHEC